MNEEGKAAPTAVDEAKMRLKELQEKREQRETKTENGKPAATEKDIHPVKAKPKKKKFSQKLKEAMFSEDIGKGSVTDHIFFKIFIPSCKRVLSDMANTAINMALGLDPKTRTIGAGSHAANAGVYRDRNYNRGGDGNPGFSRRNAVSEYEWDEETAKDIFNQMADLIERYGNCSIADAYSIMGLGDMIRTTDRNWGWTSMRNADVVPVDRIGDRWIVDMPAARPLQ